MSKNYKNIDLSLFRDYTPKAKDEIDYIKNITDDFIRKFIEYKKDSEISKEELLKINSKRNDFYYDMKLGKLVILIG